MRPAILYVAEPYRAGKPFVRILRDTRDLQDRADTLFKQLPKGYAFSGFTFTTELEKADFILVPQPVRRLDVGTRAYLEQVKAQARAAGKRLVVFVSGDGSHALHIEGAIVFCTSLFKPEQRTGELPCVAFVEDLGERAAFEPRQKTEHPHISFCGYAGFSSIGSRARYYVKNIILDIRALLGRNAHVLAYKQGVYFRRKAMRYLAGDARFVTNFIVRDTFSGNRTTVGANPEHLRREYIESITQSDFVLAPKGDANYSARFFEALSLGRVPILVDTDVVLPLEEVIDYDKIMVRVPHTDLAHIGDYVMKYYDALSPEEWVKRQELARETFEKYVRYDAFMNYVFPRLV